METEKQYNEVKRNRNWTGSKKDNKRTSTSAVASGGDRKDKEEEHDGATVENKVGYISDYMVAHGGE